MFRRRRKVSKKATDSSRVRGQEATVVYLETDKYTDEYTRVYQLS